MQRSLIGKTSWVAAGLLALLLPFSSFPLISRLTGSSMVAPLSALPLALLVLFWLVPHLLRAGKLPAQVLPLLAFGGAALFSSGAAFFLTIPAYKSFTLLNSELKALITLAIGLCFYLVIAGWSGRPDRLRFLLRWINWSGVLVLGWSFFQAAVWFRSGTHPDWMWAFQGQVSTSLLLYGQRVTGFAYEPSWLAHQLNMLYLPFWLASAVSGYSAHRFRLGKIHFEHLLLLGGIVVLILSVSRIGLLTFLMMFAFLLLLWNIRFVRWLQQRLTRGMQADTRRAVITRRWTGVISILVLLALYAGLIYGAAYGISRYDERMRRLFDFSALQEGSLLQYANQLVFAERIVFWQAGWEVFNEYPVVGVGLGNAGYFFPQKLSGFSWALTEVRTLMYRQTNLPNTKSLWVRLLAETGIVGFAFFACWCYILWQSAQFLRAHRDSLFRMVGFAGSFAVIGFLMEGFSLDTFALPYYWVTFGLLTGACELARCSQSANTRGSHGITEG
jgi:hypothetical protein